MGIEMIGKTIASLRKEKGIRQEELANYVGVSTQAVSKWENGGVPDIALLPEIANFFSVSVDSLFGRDITDYSGLQTALCQKIIETAHEQRFKAALEFCWDIERALCGGFPEGGGIEEYEKKLDRDEQRYSSVISDHGFTRMGIANRLQYFLLVPEPHDADAAFFEDVDYSTFFKDFSDKDVFDACVFLYKRESDKAFTQNLLINNLKLEPVKAAHILNVLEKNNLLYKTLIEMDDETRTVYNFKPSPSFVAFLIFAREMIKTPNSFSFYMAGRNKPYFN